ncbi:hypothetical protein I4F81_010276 [Pyropia yezoensis]|uniref:Uncharacterized protein n=1 Tax=Pyropia yezoensis TaxID=2788 RepID=A0ACC3CCQ3_PYRYE|nr:hypothetical protein I4F81_010276 [Neopyropia yezoensis]
MAAAAVSSGGGGGVSGGGCADTTRPALSRGRSALHPDRPCTQSGGSAGRLAGEPRRDRRARAAAAASLHGRDGWRGRRPREQMSGGDGRWGARPSLETVEGEPAPTRPALPPPLCSLPLPNLGWAARRARGGRRSGCGTDPTVTGWGGSGARGRAITPPCRVLTAQDVSTGACVGVMGNHSREAATALQYSAPRDRTPDPLPIVPAFSPLRHLCLPRERVTPAYAIMSGAAAANALTKKVSATKEILIGAGLAIAGGVVWRSWHMSYKSNVDEYYAKYEAAQRAKNAQQQQQ